MIKQQEEGANKISAEVWHNNAKHIKIKKEDMNKLVLNFFIFEGYRESAINFAKVTNTEISQTELDKMTDRIEIRKYILNGEIDQALKRFEQSENVKLVFSLKMQKLIEMIKQNQIQESISYAQQYVVQHLEEQPHLLEEIEKIMSLIVFEDFNTSPMGHLTHNSQRIKVASEINTMLLQNEQGSKLSLVMKVLMWAQKSLSTKQSFPEIVEISSGQFVKDE